jgi:hypothetical protein
MKSFKALIFIVFITMNVYSQENKEEKNYPNEIGIGVTNLLKTTFIIYQSYYEDANFFSTYMSSDFNYNNPYDITYNYNFKKFTLRGGYGQLIYNDKTHYSYNQNGQIQNSYEDINDKDQEYYFRAGIQKNVDISKSWQYYYGLDAIGGIASGSLGDKYVNNMDYTIYKTSQHGYTYGGGPFLGIRWKLNRRLSLVTETSLYFVYRYSKVEYKKDQYYSYDDSYYSYKNENINKDILMRFNIPMTIFLQFRL